MAMGETAMSNIDSETLQGMANLCRFMIAWAEREPDEMLPDVLGICVEVPEILGETTCRNLL
jgi:hypothetical protein